MNPLIIYILYLKSFDQSIYLDWGMIVQMSVFFVHPQNLVNIGSMSLFKHLLADYFPWLKLRTYSFSNDQVKAQPWRKQQSCPFVPKKNSWKLEFIEEKSEFKKRLEGRVCFVLVHHQNWIYRISMLKGILHETLPILNPASQLIGCGDSCLFKTSRKHANVLAFLHQHLQVTGIYSLESPQFQECTSNGKIENKPAREADHIRQWTSILRVEERKQTESKHTMGMHSEEAPLILHGFFFVNVFKTFEVFMRLHAAINKVDKGLTSSQRKLQQCYHNHANQKIKIECQQSIEDYKNRTMKSQLQYGKENVRNRFLEMSKVIFFFCLVNHQHNNLLRTNKIQLLINIILINRHISNFYTKIGQKNQMIVTKLLQKLNPSQNQIQDTKNLIILFFLPIQLKRDSDAPEKYKDFFKLISAVMEGGHQSILLFINSGSGGGVGKALVQLQIDRIDFNLSPHHYSVFFYNMRKNRDQGFLHLKNLTQNQQAVIAVICGGDGTVMWVVSEIAKNGIDPRLVHLAIMPLGTGNDFSRNLGWGKEQTELTQNGFKELKHLIKDWTTAEVQNLDVWEVAVDVWDYGRFEKVENSEDVVIEGKSLRKHFVNYFSFGIDGEIGYEFDKRRTSTRFGNLAVYGAMGIKTSLQKAKTLGELVEVMTYGTGQKVFEGNGKTLLDYVGNPFSFNFSDLVEGMSKINSFHNNQNLLALNINSYMAGVTDIWKKAKPNGKIIQNTPTSDPSHYDGKIEFVSFSDTGKIGLEKTFGGLEIGFAERITQGEGPFFIKFKEYPNDPSFCTYFQIDGEFIKAVHPRQLILKKSTLFPGSQIKVLHRR